MFDIKMLTPDSINEYWWSLINEKDTLIPREYFNFAQQDRNDGTTDRHLVNSIANSKRAIHLRMENLYNGYGGAVIEGKPHNYNDLVGFLRKCGIISPRILDRINKIRNLIEHEYYVPSIDEVDTFLDITELFLGATDVLITNKPASILFNTTLTTGFYQKFKLKEMRFVWDVGNIEFVLAIDDSPSCINRTIEKIDFKNPIYFDCINFSIKHMGNSL
jgi:hypothetical protein